MTASSSVQNWTLTIPAGSLSEWALVFTSPGSGAPWGLGASWEYAVRPTATDLTVPPLVSITENTTTPGNIAVASDAALAQLLLTINPAATSGLVGEFSHTLWSDPGTPQAAPQLSGTLTVEGTAQP